MTGDNTLLLVVARRVTRKLEDLSSQVLKYCREVNCNRTEQCAEFEQVQLLTRGTSTNTLRVVALLQETVHTTDGELEARLRGARLRLGGRIAGSLARLRLAAALARHVASVVKVVVVR